MWWIPGGVQSIVKLNMYKFPICSIFILPHATKAQCSICTYLYHMKCISLDPEDLSYIELNRSSWCCCDCITKIFPFNHIEHDELFISEVNGLDLELETIESFISKAVQPVWNKQWWNLLPTVWYWSWCTLLQWIKYTHQSELQLLLWTFVFKCYSKPIYKHYRSQSVSILLH